MIRPSVPPDSRIHQADPGLAMMDQFAVLNSPVADSLVGKTVAQYDVIAKLGGGGMGVVYTAKDTKLGRLVALKFLPPQWSHDDNAKQRFIREAQAASATDHRNICTIHNIESTDDGQLFIVMAHYEGLTLKQKLEAGPLAVDEALEIAAQVAEGLTKAHAQGVVHRDIKPGNLMITDDTVKILDFGLAKFADSLQLTIVGSTLGTVAYMSPEQTKGEEADARSDLWAVGVVLYEMLTGQLPFRGTYPEAISYAIRNDPPPPLPAAEPEIP
jgi:eukaryotic-like serine/threonine-protein kinase